MDLAIYPGEIHAVLGENGAGKSTLVGILSGNLTADSGSLQVEGRNVEFHSAREARAHGIDIVQQHFMLVPAFSVAENLALFSLTRNPLASVESASADAIGIGSELGWHFNPGARTGSLSVGAMQRVEIVKALAGGKRVTLFDEPTATLSKSETNELFRVLRELKGQGRGVVLITHKLSEALEIADRITVLRRGKVVVSLPAQGVAKAQLAQWMVGDVPAALTEQRGGAKGRTVVSVRDLTLIGEHGEPKVDNVSLDVSAGEIVGIGGVSGNGQIELAEALAGVRPGVGAPRAAYIPEDRQRDGLALDMTIVENMLITGHSRPGLVRMGVLLLGRIRAWCETLVAKFGVRTESIDDAARSLSGGNQQKVVVARCLDENPEFIVAVNPTRGLDVQAERFVHEQLLAARERGAAIALFSTDLDELALLADRTFIMSSGKLGQGGDVAEMLGGVE